MAGAYRANVTGRGAQAPPLLDDPDTVKRLAELGGTVPAKADRGPEHLEQVLKADIERWDPILKKAMAESKTDK